MLEPVFRALCQHPLDGFSKRYRLLEHLRQDVFEDILKKQEQSIAFVLHIRVEADDGKKFVLQMHRCDDGTCATTDVIVNANETNAIELRHGQKSVIKVIAIPDHMNMDNQKRECSVFRRFFDRSAVMVSIKAKTLIPNQQSTFSYNSTATVKCTLQLIEPETGSLGLTKFSNFICRLKDKVKNHDDLNVCIEIFKIICTYYNIQWPLCKLILLSHCVRVDEDRCNLDIFILCQNTTNEEQTSIQIEPHSDLDEVLQNCISRFGTYLKNQPNQCVFALKQSTSQAEVNEYFKPVLLANKILQGHPMSEGLVGLIQHNVTTNFTQSLKELSWNGLQDTSNSLGIIDFVIREKSRNLCQLYRLFNTDYIQVAVSAIEVEVRSNIKAAMRCLKPRDDQNLRNCTMYTMRMFETLHQLTEFLKTQKTETILSGFESWFLQVSVYWTHSWRCMYIDFIKKSVEDSDVHQPVSENGFEGRYDVDVHEGAVLCLAFCKTLCDDFARLAISDESLSLTCALQIVSIMSDGLIIYSSRLHQHTLQQKITFTEVVKAANGIEHATDNLIGNLDKFLNMRTLLNKLGTGDQSTVTQTIRKILETTRCRAKTFSTDLIKRLSTYKYGGLRKECIQLAESNKKFVDVILSHVESLCSSLKPHLLPRLYYVAIDAMWQDIVATLRSSLEPGQPPSYYEAVAACLEATALNLGVDIQSGLPKELKTVLFLNKFSTQDLVLQYYASLGDLCLDYEHKSDIPRLTLILNYVQATNRTVLLNVDIMSANGIPIHEHKMSDPFVRLELYPRHIFPLSEYPAEMTSTRKRCSNPTWNETFQIMVPEDKFFVNGASLCITLLNKDVLSYQLVGGQCIYPLAAISRLQCPELNDITVVPLLKHTPNQLYSNEFQVLKERCARDKLAKEVVDYENYLSAYRIMPPSALGAYRLSWTTLLFKWNRLRRSKSRVTHKCHS